MQEKWQTALELTVCAPLVSTAMMGVVGIDMAWRTPCPEDFMLLWSSAPHAALISLLI